MVSPSPVPLMLNSLFFLITVNILNRCCASSLEMPVPVSLTVNSSQRPRSVCLSRTLRSMPPLSVNLNEFEIRFMSTCLMRPMSELNCVAISSASQKTSKRMPLRSHCTSKMYLISVTRLPTMNTASLRLKMPASILAMSRMSSVSDSSSFDEMSQIRKNFLFRSAIFETSVTLRLLIGCTLTSLSTASLFDSSSDNAFEKALIGVLNSCDMLENITLSHSLVAFALASFLM